MRERYAYYSWWVGGFTIGATYERTYATYHVDLPPDAPAASRRVLRELAPTTHPLHRDDIAFTLGSLMGKAPLAFIDEPTQATAAIERILAERCVACVRAQGAR